MHRQPSLVARQSKGLQKVLPRHLARVRRRPVGRRSYGRRFAPSVSGSRPAGTPFSPLQSARTVRAVHRSSSGDAYPPPRPEGSTFASLHLLKGAFACLGGRWSVGVKGRSGELLRAHRLRVWLAGTTLRRQGGNRGAPGSPGQALHAGSVRVEVDGELRPPCGDGAGCWRSSSACHPVRRSVAAERMTEDRYALALFSPRS